MIQVVCIAVKEKYLDLDPGVVHILYKHLQCQLVRTVDRKLYFHIAGEVCSDCHLDNYFYKQGSFDDYEAYAILHIRLQEHKEHL